MELVNTSILQLKNHNMINKTIRRATFLFIFLLSVLFSIAQNQLTADIIVKRKKINEMDLSPNGEKLLFTILQHTNNEESNKSSTLVLSQEIIDSTFFGEDNTAHSYKWSPDGSYLAYISSKGENGRQVWLYNLADKSDLQLTQEEYGVLMYDWHYNSDNIGYLKEEFTSSHTKKLFEKGIYPSNETAKKRILIEISIKTKRLRQLYHGSLYINGFSYSPTRDESLITISESNNPGEVIYGSKLALLNPDGTIKVLNEISYGDISWSPDGNYISFFHAAGKIGKTNLPAIINRTGDYKKILTSNHLGKITNTIWKDEKTMYVLDVYGINNFIRELNVENDNIKTVVEVFCEGESSLAYDRLKKELYYTSGAYNKEKDIFLYKESNKTIKQLTNLNPGLSQYNFGKVESVKWPSVDGLEIEGILVYPINYDTTKKYPLVVQLHGGPEWNWSKGFISSWHDWGQILSNHGYMVFLPNFRGSIGYGVDFIEKNTNDWGGNDVEDVIYGVEYLLKNHAIDKNRIGIGGWSYGGFLTATVINRSNLFKTALIGAGPMDLISQYNSSDNTKMMDYYFSGSPLNDFELYKLKSPIYNTANINVPTLIMHGDQDSRVHPNQSKAIYKTLKQKGLETELVFYHNEGHGFTMYSHKIDLINRVLEWFYKQLKEKIN